MKQTIIFLNGASSSGKTSIANELLKLTPCLYLSVDEFISKQPSELLNDKDKLKVYFPEIISEFHKAIKEAFNKGNSLVIDHVLEELDWYEECKDLLKDNPVIWVSVKCPFKELERRELKRKDRNIGLAKLQYGTVYKDYKYDIQVDTSKITPKNAAIKILSYASERV